MPDAFCSALLENKLIHLSSNKLMRQDLCHSHILMDAIAQRWQRIGGIWTLSGELHYSQTKLELAFYPLVVSSRCDSVASHTQGEIHPGYLHKVSGTCHGAPFPSLRSILGFSL